MVWWYNILGGNRGSISHLLRIYPNNEGYFLTNANLINLKRENIDPILIVKRNECRKLIDYFGLSIEANPSRVGKKNIYIFCTGYTPRPLSGNTHISRHYLDNYL